MLILQRAPRLRAGYPWVIVLLLSVGLTTWHALSAGLDANWDFLNYHYWSVYALFEGRAFYDIAPAQVQSWLNPIVYVPVYLAIELLPPAVATVVMAVFAGFNGLLLYLLAIKVADHHRGLGLWVVVVSIVTIGLTGPIFLSQVGTSFADPLCSLLVVGGVLVIFMRRPASLFLAGFALGAAVGLKLTTAPFAVAAFVALLVGWRQWQLTPRGLAGFISGGILGAISTGGLWAFYLYLETGSPLFPFYNAVFQSPLYWLDNFSDNRFRPESLASALWYPVQLFLGQHPTAEVEFRDPRFLIISGLLVIYLARVSIGQRAKSDDENAQADTFRFFMVFFLFSYAIWLTLWGIHRYATALELLSGIMMFLLVDRIASNQRTKVITITGLALFTVVTTSPANWGRVALTDTHYVHEVEGPPGAEPNTLYLIAGDGEPVAYMLPAMASDARFVRLTGNHGVQMQGAPLGRVISGIIDLHLGPLRTLSVGRPDHSDSAVLQSYGLALDHVAGCDTFEALPLTNLWSCRLVRDKSAGPPMHSEPSVHD